MRPNYPLVGLLITCACGTSEIEPLGGHGARVPASPHVSSFETSAFGLGMRDPVVVVDATGRIHRAAISRDEGWPVFLLPDGTQRRFAGDGSTARELAMTSGPQGRLHAVWMWETELMYGRFDPETLEGQVHTAARSQIGQPNLAVGPDGSVAITYVSGYWSRIPNQRLEVRIGTAEDGFSLQENVNPRCCGEGWGSEGGWTVSHAAVEFDSGGDLHIAYTWNGIAGTVLEYLSNRSGTWENLGRLQGDMDYGAPGLAVDARGAHITYVHAERQQVRAATVVDGSFSEPRVLLSAGEVNAARAKMDSQGILHIAVESIQDDRVLLEYVRDDRLDEVMQIAETTETEERLLLNPAAGGVLISRTGELLFPYARRLVPQVEWGTVEVAVGR